MFTASIEYCGGLGNQLFQLFTLLSYSIDKNKRPVVIYSETSPSITKRPTYWNSIFSQFKNFTDTLEGQRFHEINGFVYNPIPYLDDNVVLSGYYQSYKYFFNNFEKICDMLKLRDKQTLIEKELSSYLDRENKEQKIISVHFRLGDYKHLQQHHPLLQFSYYKNAINLIKTKVGTNIKILCFCELEDTKFVSDVISKLELENVTIVSPDIEDWKQMLLMSLCDWNVIANSTFSWWGAVLNKNRENVIYPSKWFHTDTPDGLVLPSWIKIGY